MTRSRIVILIGVLMFSGSAHAQSTREVRYNPHSVVRVRAKLRFTTMIILPESEEILDFVCGDKDLWVVSGAQHLAYVKPAQAGATTNLNLVTAAGHVYSFLLTEGAADPDLKIYVTSDDEIATTAGASPKLFAAAQVEAFRHEADDARKAADTARTEASQAIERATTAATRSADDRVTAFRATFPTTLQFPYRYRWNEKPFFVTGIFHDDQFTYIRAKATELPSLYEVRDHAPNLVNFQVEHDTYIVPKVLDRGYLVVGGHKLVFDRVQ
ncbi:MAG: TrbG/VirB9 family P-type conjugative transfer protein [Acidobacteriota bacterium]